MRLMGYTDRLSVAPGGTVEFKVSADAQPYDVQLVRLRGVGADHGDVVEEIVANVAAKSYPGRAQQLHTGSYAVAAVSNAVPVTMLGFSVWVMPTLVDRDRQTVLSVQSDTGTNLLRLDMVRDQFELTTSAGTVSVTVDKVEKRWLRISGKQSADGLSLTYELDGRWPSQRQKKTATVATAAPVTANAARIIIAADKAGDAPGHNLFNGRISNPSLTSEGKVLAAWDFAKDIETRGITDSGPHGWSGVLVNRPGRGVRSQNWAGEILRYKDAPEQWAAIHFHDDDLNDAQWETDFSIMIDADQPSGIYAAKLTQGAQTEYLPFYVQPKADSGNKIVFLAPTNTYLAYANEHLGFGERGEAHQKRMREAIQLNDTDEYVHSHPELGLSIYDRHADGSGVMYSSWQRPVLNFRPNYITWLNASRRHFAADFYITGWLEQLGVGYDVITDEDMHNGGLELLKKYDVLLTGSHPEYPTSKQMQTFYDFVGQGGSMMYLGGNGFYWVTSFDGDDTMTLECRRGFAGERNWTSHPAELDHSSTGEVGGTYTHRGQTGRQLCGVTSVGVGWGDASGYTRTQESRSPDLAFLFKGIGDDEMIGSFGHMLGGAAGDELDAADFDNGTPPNARILMSSRHNDTYYPFLETVTQVEPNVSGPNNPNVRSDVVFIDTGTGGKILSAGSICWAGSLAWNGYQNNVATLCENALRDFLK
jgi:N,N-dimethylformamidase